MARTVSSRFMRAVLAQETEEAFIQLLTISHADLDAPLRFTDNDVDVISGGDTYTAFPFLINMPEDNDGQIQQMSLSIDNIDRAVTAAIESLSSPATISLSIVLAATPDTVEAGPIVMTLRNVNYDALTVSGTLSNDDILNEPFPKDAFTPSVAPGIFGIPVETSG